MLSLTPAQMIFLVTQMYSGFVNKENIMHIVTHCALNIFWIRIDTLDSSNFIRTISRPGYPTQVIHYTLSEVVDNIIDKILKDIHNTEVVNEFFDELEPLGF